MTQLALVIDLNVCVGCHACVTSCKEWNTSGSAGPLPDTKAYGEQYAGTFFNRVQTFEVGCYPDTETVHFPKSCLHCEDPPCVPVCPTGASYKRKEDGIVLVDYDKCIGCKYCSWACPYGARELDDHNRVMKKCTLCVDRIYDAALEPRDRKPACVLACPTSARLFGDIHDPASEVSRAIREEGGYPLMPEWGTHPANHYLPRRKTRVHIHADELERADNPLKVDRQQPRPAKGEPTLDDAVTWYPPMRPAFSVILLTTLLGAGQGLFLAIFTHQAYASLGLIPATGGKGLYGPAAAVALVILAAGLVASFFHLGRPERAWRSAAMWRTSWLSREVIVLPAFMGMVFVYGALHLTGMDPVLVRLPGGFAVPASWAAGVAGSVLAFALFVCTGMIYACLKFLREWHSPLTIANYILLGTASGFTLAAALSPALAPAEAPFFAGWALAFTALGALSRGASLVRNARLRPVSTLQTAIGVRHPVIRQISQGFTAGSFNTREFFHGQAMSLVRSVKWLFLLFAFAIPAALLAAHLATGSPAALAAAIAAQMAGLMAERWFFFAEANHPQNLYYQAVA